MGHDNRNRFRRTHRLHARRWLAAGAIAMVGLLFCRPNLDSLAQRPAPRRMATPTIDGVTEPFLQVDVAAPEPGLLSAMRVQEGDRVGVGDLLAELDLNVLQASLEIARMSAEARGRLDAATAELRLQEDRLQKFLELRESGFAREAELQRARTDVEIATARVLSAHEERQVARLEVAQIEAQMERRRLRSPLNGVVTRIHRDAGEYVSPSQPEVVTVVQLNPLRVVFNMPAAHAVPLSPGQVVQLRFSETGNTVDARVEFVAPVNDAESGTVRVKVLLDNSEGRFRSGVRCQFVPRTAG